MPCHHTLEAYLHAYRDGAGIANEPKGPLFRTVRRGTGQDGRTRRVSSRGPLPVAYWRKHSGAPSIFSSGSRMNDASYVAKAVPLATDTARLVELRAGLRERPLA
jgi:hypothetical protein